MNQHIHCTVDNCYYWGQGNRCEANEILITSDVFGDEAPENFDAPQASAAPPTPCDTCMETCCKTFANKNSPDFDVDGVHKG